MSQNHFHFQTASKLLPWKSLNHFHHFQIPVRDLKQFFNFTSKRETDYRLVQPKRPPRKPGQDKMDYVLSQPVDSEPLRIVGNGVAKRSTQIADPMLFEQFSKLGPTTEYGEPPAYLDGSEEALRDFVRRYGRLTDEKAGDNVYLLLDEAGKMKDLLETFRRL